MTLSFRPLVLLLLTFTCLIQFAALTTTEAPQKHDEDTGTLKKFEMKLSDYFEEFKNDMVIR